jgi:hypothetical protein
VNIQLQTQEGVSARTDNGTITGIRQRKKRCKGRQKDKLHHVRRLDEISLGKSLKVF